MMEEWKNELLNKYDLEELVPDNVFLYKYGLKINFNENMNKQFMEVFRDLGLHYQILSILQDPILAALWKSRILIVVGKKQE
jgi:hypothetical protein